MPIPVLQNLPDNDPIEALRLCRNYLRDLVNYFSPLKIAAWVMLFPTGVIVTAYYVFGFDPVLSWGSDFVPLAFTVVGIILTLKKLREEHHSAVIALLVIVGVLGTLVLHLSRTRTEATHAKEISGLRERMDSVRDQNGQLLTKLLSKPPQSSQEAELERRTSIEKVLRGEYILSHDNISPGILAGTELPPTNWMNKRLHELGEKWAIIQPVSQKLSPPPSEKARYEVSFWPALIPEWPIHQKAIPLVNGIATATLTFMIKDHMAKKTQVWLRLCKACKYAKEPPGFKDVNTAPLNAADEENERVLEVGDFLPNVAYAPIISVDVIPPVGQASFEVGLAVGCENCDPIDATKFQILRVNIQQ